MMKKNNLFLFNDFIFIAFIRSKKNKIKYFCNKKYWETYFYYLRIIITF